MHPLVSLFFLWTALDLTGTVSSRRVLRARVTQLEKMTSQLARQLILQQLHFEESARSAGDSGIKQVRLRNDGTKSYFTDTHTSRSVAAMHDHSDHVRTCGMGEVVAVLNGVEFRTRHNDYMLRKPSTWSGEYHATEEIAFPKVPPEVLKKDTVQGQMVEMRKWFKAWRDGDHSVRDYRKYFKPLLCYLEGAWTTDDELHEPFDSDRHHLDAKSWFELQEQIRYTSYTGDKHYLENFAYLPTMLLNATSSGVGESADVPELAHWNYRILCHPIQGGFKLRYLKPVDNLASRLARQTSFDDYVNSRAARFSVYPFDSDQAYSWSRLDILMGQVPGKDNYGGNLTDSLFGQQKLHMHHSNPRQPLNTAFYHRWYRIHKKDAMGGLKVHRGFADRNLYVAETSQLRVAPMSMTSCRNGNKKKCRTETKRVSYAIPLEIVFLTPLQTWNPYGVEYKGKATSERGSTVRKGGRDGGPTSEKAFNGTNSKTFYMTPLEFFVGDEVHSGPADSTRQSVGVLDQTGTVRAMKSSGLRIFLPQIHEVGILRTRYPIMPVYNEGDPVWKELEALRDLVLDMNKYWNYFHAPPTAFRASSKTGTSLLAGHKVLVTSPSSPGPPGLHAHTLELTAEDSILLTQWNETVTLDTSEDNGHSHTVVVDYDEETGDFVMLKCDGADECFDGHTSLLQEVKGHVSVP